MPLAGALQGCRVVVTRPADQAEELAAPLRSAGADVRVRPLVRLDPPADGGRALEAAASQLDRYEWLVFTSANAVRAWPVFRAATRWPAVACVGEATARAASARGIPVSLVPASFTGEAVAQAMEKVAALRGARVLWPRASGAGDAVRATLGEAGAIVDEVEAYRTCEDAAAARRLHEELSAEPADLVVFTSPSGVRAFAGGGRWPGAVAVIGTVTRDAARTAGLDVQVLPAAHTVNGLVEAIAAWQAVRRG